MAAKGTAAKQYVAKKLQEIFQEDYIGEYDKKFYVWAPENGEKIQISISMTCPKTPVGEGVKTAVDWSAAPNTSNVLNFEEMDNQKEPEVITVDERDTVQKLMEFLGLD